MENNGFLIGEHANKNGVLIHWLPDSSMLNNPHMLIAGQSGSGKTTLLKKIILWLEKKKKHIIVYDFKGDMKFTDEEGKVIGNYIEFTSWGSNYGINPFEFDKGLEDNELKKIIEENLPLTPEQEFKIKNSGPKVQIERIIEMLIKNILPNMGSAQKEITRYLLQDAYNKKGIIYDDIATWINSLPSFENVIEIIEQINIHLKTKERAEDDETKEYIKTLKKLIVDLNDLEFRLKSKDEEYKDDVKESIEKIKNEIEQLQNDYIEYGKRNFKRKDIEKYDTKEWFVKNRIDISKYYGKEKEKAINMMAFYFNSLLNAGVFHSNKPPLKTGLNVIKLSGLDVSMQRFVTDLFLGKSFNACKIRGEYKKKKDKSRGAKFDTVHIIDESKLIAGNNKEKNDPYSYLNRIATEARSYGMALIVASQSATHFPPEFLKNFATQIILNTSIADLKTTEKAFGVNKEMLEFVQNGWGRALVKTGKIFVKTKI